MKTYTQKEMDDWVAINKDATIGAAMLIQVSSDLTALKATRCDTCPVHPLVAAERERTELMRTMRDEAIENMNKAEQQLAALTASYERQSQEMGAHVETNRRLCRELAKRDLTQANYNESVRLHRETLDKLAAKNREVERLRGLLQRTVSAPVAMSDCLRADINQALADAPPPAAKETP